MSAGKVGFQKLTNKMVFPKIILSILLRVYYGLIK